ncbi:MAG: ketoacyl-ACP synthase III [Gammaproteobacteria bacterium]|nr:ketoacyl-ACP synthase III [Gammaproteobacteria bacterium]
MTFARIIGTGSYMPERILTNADLEQMVDTTDQWILDRTGIRERRIIAEDQKVSDLAEIAAKRALEASGTKAVDIDLVIVASATSELIFPSLACLIQQRLGIGDCPAFDINAACTGFIYQLDVANQFIKNGSAKNVLLVAAEGLSKVVDWDDRATCVLFSDGAGAVVLTADSKPGIRSTHIHADGTYSELLYAPSGRYGDDPPHIRMKGNDVFKVAVTKLGAVVTEALQANNLVVDDIDWLVPHQANLRIIKATAKRIHLPMERVILTIEKQGNTSAASVPLALDTGVREGKIKAGDTVLMEAFGAGFTWGSALVDF